MPFGIIECHKLEVVPGTAFMSDQDEVPPEYHDVPRDQLKHGTGRFSNVILVPQPSDSPNDPLNVSLPNTGSRYHTDMSSGHNCNPPNPPFSAPLIKSPRKKEMILVIVGLSASVVGAFGPMLSPGFVEIAADLHISINTLAQSTAWLILTIGLGLFIANPLAKIYGKRPVYIVAIAIMFATSVWGAATTEYNSFLASRIIAGVGMAPYEVLVQCTIGDLYFVHERATRIAVWNLFLLTGISGGALVAGYIIQDDGYRWTFGVCAIFFGILMLGVVFLVPETSYRRGEYIHSLIQRNCENPSLAYTFCEMRCPPGNLQAGRIPPSSSPLTSSERQSNLPPQTASSSSPSRANPSTPKAKTSPRKSPPPNTFTW